MANTRTPRELETREKTQTRYVYKPASTLPEPAPDPDYDFHWMAITVNGQENSSNISQKRRDGWVPVKAVDYPELEIDPNKNGEVENGGLLLCKIPKEMNQSRREFFEKKAQNQKTSENTKQPAGQDYSNACMFDTSMTEQPGFSLKCHEYLWVYVWWH